MITLRNYEQLIRDCVKEISDNDPNWDFVVKSFAKDRVRIRWTYLDYCGEKNNCFFLHLREYDEEFNDYFITSRTPDDSMIDGHIVTTIIDTKKSWQESFENAIKSAIDEIADYAHSRY